MDRVRNDVLNCGWNNCATSYSKVSADRKRSEENHKALVSDSFFALGSSDIGVPIKRLTTMNFGWRCSSSHRERTRHFLRKAGAGILRRLALCLVGLVAAALSGSAAVADDVPIGLKTVWGFDQLGIARFCYDKTPAVIYPKYDVARKMTSIVKRELDGDEHVVGEFPGSPDPRSLSCSQDGQTIVALGTIGAELQASLFLSQGTRTSIYLFPSSWLFSNVGLYSLLSPDGTSITLPEQPGLVAGPDLLKDMTVFPNDKKHNVFFMDGYAYLDEKDDVYKYVHSDGNWKKQRAAKRPPEYNVSEVARCGDHDVATLIGTDSSRFTVFGEDLPPKQDWLERIGVRKLLRKHGNPESITGSYGACALPLRDRAAPQGAAHGLARFDANGLQLFAFPEREVWLGDDDVNFSKDGCYVLIRAAPGTRLLAVQSPRCQ
jgi:hypothetical protein